MKKFLFQILKYSIIVLVLGNIFGFSCQYFLKKSNFYKPSFLINHVKKTNTLDYILLGSSRGLTTINTQQVDKKLNTKGLNLSMDDTDLKTHLLMLKHFINNGYKTKQCVLTLDIQNFKKTNTKLGNNDYRFTPFSNQQHVKEHFKQYESQFIKPIYNSYWFPFLAYSYYNLELIPSSIIAMIKPKHQNRFDKFGNYAYPNKKNKKNINRQIKTADINNPILEEFKKIADQNNVELIIYIAPLLKKEIQITSCNYPLINHSATLQNSELFYDDIHVTENGRKEISDIFSKDLKKISLNY